MAGGNLTIKIECSCGSCDKYPVVHEFTSSGMTPSHTYTQSLDDSVSVDNCLILLKFFHNYVVGRGDQAIRYQPKYCHLTNN